MLVIGGCRTGLDDPMDIGKELPSSRHRCVHSSQEQEGCEKAEYGTDEHSGVLGKTQGLQSDPTEYSAAYEADQRHAPHQKRDSELGMPGQSQLDQIARTGADAILRHYPACLGRASTQMQSAGSPFVALPAGTAERSLHFRPITLRTDDDCYLHRPHSPRGL